jgi:hypothetical protein
MNWCGPITQERSIICEATAAYKTSIFILHITQYFSHTSINIQHLNFKSLCCRSRVISTYIRPWSYFQPAIILICHMCTWASTKIKKIWICGTIHLQICARTSTSGKCL